MSHGDKIQQVLEYIINEEADAASDLLHSIVVAKAREIYEELVDEEELDEMEGEELDENDEELDEAEDCDDDEELEEGLGGDMKDDFANNIRQEEDEIDSDEMYDDSEGEEEGEEEFGGEEGDDEFGGEEEGEGTEEERIEDLEMALADLRAEFDTLMSDEMEEPYHDEEDFEMGGEPEMGMEPEMDMAMEPEEGGYYESVSEATKLQDQVADPAMKQEGKYSGTGKNSKDASTGNKKSPYTNAPTRKDYGGKATDFAKSSGNSEGKAVDKSAKKDSCEDNIDVPEKSQSADLKGEGKFSGTGKNSKKGQTFTKSPLTKKPS